MNAADKIGAGLDRVLTMELVRVTERAAVAAARLRGRGDEKAADQVAVDAMRTELNRLAIKGTVVIGEGERDEAPMLYIGEEVGTGKGPEVDIALDPLEGTTICAKNLPNALAVVALAEKGSLLNAPDVYMDKIAIGPGYAADVIDIDASPAENIARLANAKGVPVGEVTACILDRPRHAKLIEAVRGTGAAIRLIGDGDVAGVIHTTDPEETGIDIYMGIGGAPEGVLAAAALRCTGGQMQGRLILDTPEKVERSQQGLSRRRDGARRRAVRRNRRDRRQHALGREVRPQLHHHAYNRAAFVVAHRTRDQGAPSGSGQVLITVAILPAYSRPSLKACER
jgi:fructose-1,6-bisphosphatase II / sedoheptulose-1,7-bisphosphatase